MAHPAELRPMSVTVLSVVPTNHLWQPTREAADMAVQYLRQVDGKAVNISAEFRDHVTLYDTGDNWEPTLTCPNCGTPKTRESLDAWIGDRLGEVGDFRDLEVLMDCCSRRASLNGVLGRLTWPMAFASFSLRVETPTRASTNPDQPWFTADEMAQVAELVGHECRQVLADY